MTILLAIILGASFGFVIHRIGASNPHNIINMLRLTDLHLMKTILFGIAIASAFLFIGLAADIIPASHLDIKTSYWGVLIGGLIMGVGWAFTGYCPSTSMAALGDGRKDAIFFILGGLFGTFLYMLVYSSIQRMPIMGKVLGGNATLAATPESSAVISGVPGVITGLVVAIIIALIAWKLPGKRA